MLHGTDYRCPCGVEVTVWLNTRERTDKVVRCPICLRPAEPIEPRLPSGQGL